MEDREQQLHDKLAAISAEYTEASDARKVELVLEIEALEDEAGQYFGEERSRLRQLWTDKQHNFIAATAQVVRKIRIDG